MFDQLARKRAGNKLDWIQSHVDLNLKGAKVLDLGCAEGYLGEHCQQNHGSHSTLLDVVDMNRSTIPLTLYDGETIPFDDKRFDLCFLIFVLHHTSDAIGVLKEALRVSEKVVIMESVYESPWDLRQLTFLDKLTNRFRSGGLMNAQEELLHFRRDREWIELFQSMNLKIKTHARKGRYFHQQALYFIGQ